MPIYKVIEPIKMGGAKYVPGESVELVAKDAAPLIAAGVLAAPPKAEKVEK